MTKDEKRRDKYYRKTYGISLKDYNRMLKSQGGKCALCGKSQKPGGSRLAVEHNHRSGRVRGLVDFYCNKFLIGRHNLETATKLYEYMLKYEGENK